MLWQGWIISFLHGLHRMYLILYSSWKISDDKWDKKIVHIKISKMLSHEFCFLGKAGILNLHESKNTTFHFSCRSVWAEVLSYGLSFLGLSSQSLFLMRCVASWSKSFCIEFKLFFADFVDKCEKFRIDSPIFLNFRKTSQSSLSPMNMSHFTKVSLSDMHLCHIHCFTTRATYVINISFISFIWMLCGVFFHLEYHIMILILRKINFVPYGAATNIWAYTGQSELVPQSYR